MDVIQFKFYFYPVFIPHDEILDLKPFFQMSHIDRRKKKKENLVPEFVPDSFSGIILCHSVAYSRVALFSGRCF